MAKAHITTKDGATINLEGTAEEVAALVAKFGLLAASPPLNDAERAPLRPAINKKRSGKVKSAAARSTKNTATSLVTEMIESGSLNKPRGLGDIKADLEQGGHYFTNPAIATALLRKVKKRELRRIKKDNAWTYVV